MPWIERVIALVSPNAATASYSLVMRTGTFGATSPAPGVYVSTMPTTDVDGTAIVRGPVSTNTVVTP
ncbi:hypothetical protein WJ63_15315 [Burkholderia pyrrocinia]|nr:hypothetical protein WJ63_15315 [Burkholderia pyrrocinia]